jgi:hypothetical protein
MEKKWKTVNPREWETVNPGAWEGLDFYEFSI